MKRRLHSGALVVFMVLFCGAGGAFGQSDSTVSLGDFARSLRKSKVPASPVLIDNDNLSTVMDQVEFHRLGGSPLFTLGGSSNSFQTSFPDGTCSLSFSANATSLLTAPYVTEELPQNELAKLDGPAVIDGDTLQVSVHNGSAWNLKEITVGLTLVRTDDTSAQTAPAKLVPASEDLVPPTLGKPSDMTLLLHLKGTVSPLATTMFRDKLPGPLAPDQEWHWAIVQAKGIPPRLLSAAPTN